MITAISLAGLAAVVLGFVIFSLKQMTKWQRLLATYVDLALPIQVEHQRIGPASI